MTWGDSRHGFGEALHLRLSLPRTQVVHDELLCVLVSESLKSPWKFFPAGTVDSGMGLFQPGLLARPPRNKRKSGRVPADGVQEVSVPAFHTPGSRDSPSRVLACLRLALTYHAQVENISRILVPTRVLRALFDQHGQISLSSG